MAAASVLLLLLQMAAMLQGTSAALRKPRGRGNLRKPRASPQLKINLLREPAVSEHAKEKTIWIRPIHEESTNEQLSANSFMALEKGMRGKDAPISEEGYFSVVKLTNDTEMSEFIRRLSGNLGLFVRDEGALSGMVGWFSGVNASQTFLTLKQELLNVAELPHSWLSSLPAVVAKDAPLNEMGYLTVVKEEKNSEMSEYIQRVAKKFHLFVRDKGALSGMVPHFSGVKASQTFFALKQEIFGIAEQPNTWIIEDPNATKNLTESVVLDGQSAPLNEAGYQLIASLKDDQQMALFTKRVAHAMDLYISDEGKLNGFVQYYSGTEAVQNFARLRKQLIDAVRDTESWIASGESVVLNEVGYRSVAALLNDEQMAVFIKRVAAHHGCAVVNQRAFMGVVPHFSGTTSVQSLALLEREVRESCGLAGSNAIYGSMHDVVGKNGVLQIRLENTTRYKYSTDALQTAGIVPTAFRATDGKHASHSQMDAACLPQNNKDTARKCHKKSRELGTDTGLGKNPGCRSKAEQAITDSHRQALMYAQDRNESEWTAIIEDDVVPLHAGFFDSSFKKAWSKMPAEAKMVRLSWCTFEQDLGSIKKETYASAGNFRLVKWMSWADPSGAAHYYTGGCTTGYLVHRSFLPELLSIFPCCCPIDCCMERQLFYKAPRDPTTAKYRGEEILMNLDAWDSREDSFNYTNFNQGGILVQDNRDLSSTRPEWMGKDL